MRYRERRRELRVADDSADVPQRVLGLGVVLRFARLRTLLQVAALGEAPGLEAAGLLGCERHRLAQRTGLIGLRRPELPVGNDQPEVHGALPALGAEGGEGVVTI